MLHEKLYVCVSISDVAFPEKYYSENFPKAEKYLKLIFLVM